MFERMITLNERQATYFLLLSASSPTILVQFLTHSTTCSATSNGILSKSKPIFLMSTISCVGVVGGENFPSSFDPSKRVCLGKHQPEPLEL